MKKTKELDFSIMEDKMLLDFLAIEQESDFERGINQMCPRCFENELDADMIMNPTSRLNGDIFICDDCGNEEAMADIGLLPQKKASEWEIFKLKETI